MKSGFLNCAFLFILRNSLAIEGRKNLSIRGFKSKRERREKLKYGNTKKF